MPNHALHSPSPAAVLPLTNNSQKPLVRNPTNNEATAAGLVMRRQNSPNTSIGRNDDAHRPKKIEVASAMMLPRTYLPITSATTMPATTPSCVTQMD